MDKLNESSESEERDDSFVTVKTEPGSEGDTIKNYAESTMNELLGLFGYEDKINSTDTENLNLDKYAQSKDEGSDAASDDETSDDKVKTAAKLRSKLRHRLITGDRNSLAQQHMNLVSALKRRELAESEESAAAETASDDSYQECAWCHKQGNQQFSLDSPIGSRVFCGELCFTQFRRASFKKSKVCDWCKHVRHTVNYVEFQDGEAQLQFCSEKCLNQYKMSIFCKETQEHLQKINEKGEQVKPDKDIDKEILITPDLWLSGESAKRAAEARESARERARMERREFRESNRKTLNAADKAPTYKPSDIKISGRDSARLSFIERIKSETNMKNKRVKEVERQSSPAKPDASITSPQPQNGATIPPHFLHPALAGMGPWLQQAQMMGSLGSGVVPFGAFPPVLYPGFVPAMPGGLVPDNASHAAEKDASERDKRNTKKDNSSHHNGRLLSPLSERSSASETSSHGDISSSARQIHSPGLGERRTSSLFPVDFPQMFQGHGFPPPQFQPSPQGATAQRNPCPSGIPPVTMMMPFPVFLPCPVPIPIPIPLTMDTIKKYVEKKCGKQMPKQNDHLNDDEDDSVKEQSYSRSHSTVSPQQHTEYDKAEVRSGSRNSCPDFSPSYRISDRRVTVSDMLSLKRSRTPEEVRSLDLSKSAKLPKYDYVDFNDNSNDRVIDLSASRDNGRKSVESSSDLGDSMINGCLDTDDSGSVHDSNDVAVDGATGIPKIHIITHQDEAPLNQHLPLPPTEHPYSSRRGLILDAPSVPKKSRSPSPERRMYVRNVPRDIIEAARRRCMRTRIRTK